MISRRRSVRSPIFEVAPSFCLQPLECCDGVSPTQAAKSRPLLKASAGGANAVAITGPTPGMVAGACVFRRSASVHGGDGSLQQRALLGACDWRGWPYG